VRGSQEQNYTAGVQNLHFQRAGRGAVMRASGDANGDFYGRIHAGCPSRFQLLRAELFSFKLSLSIPQPA
jgi:hypothetical protein